jgi:hypothetical protein
MEARRRTTGLRPGCAGGGTVAAPG